MILKMSDELSEEAKELIQKCPHIINRFAERINKLIDNWDYDGNFEAIEPIEITHVSYTKEQCGYEK